MHHHANAAEERVGDWGRADRSLRSIVGTAQRAPLATRGSAVDDDKHIGRMEIFTRSEAVAALILMLGSSGRDRLQFALHSRRIGGGTHLAAQGVGDSQIQQAGKQKSRAVWTYVKEGRDGADAVSTALSLSVE